MRNFNSSSFAYASSCQVLGTGINSSGGAGPPAAPVAEAQRDAMLKACAQANVLPCEVDYVELHATGTAKGAMIWPGAAVVPRIAGGSYGQVFDLCFRSMSLPLCSQCCLELIHLFAM